MKEYILELLKNGMWVFPVKGKGNTVEEAKRPMTFKEEDDIITWKDERILTYAEELARKDHHAWGLWLKMSYRFGIDIDIYKSQLPNKDAVAGKLVKELRNHNEIYSERSARGGIHTILYVDDISKDLSLISPEKWIEHKYDGYFIIYPSIIKLPNEELRYERIAGDILSTAHYTIGIEIINEILRRVVGDIEIRIVGGDEKLRLGTASAEIGIEERSDIKKRRPMLPAGSVFDRIKQEFSELESLQAVVALGILSTEAGCRGFAEILDKWTETGKVPIKNEVLPHGRGAHRTFESVLFVLLRELGYTVEKAEEMAAMIDYIDGIENTEPSAAAVYRYDHQSIIPLSRMSCPYGDVGKCWCASKPDWRIVNWIKRYPDRALQIIRYVKRLKF